MLREAARACDSRISGRIRHYRDAGRWYFDVLENIPSGYWLVESGIGPHKTWTESCATAECRWPEMRAHSIVGTEEW